MPRFFNTAGPCNPQDHYTLPPLRRLPGVMEPVRRKQYFVLHAPRQSGKTTAIRTLADLLCAEGAVAMWTALDRARGAKDLDRAEMVILSSILDDALALAPEVRPPGLDIVADVPPGNRLATWLRAWCAAVAPRPVLLFLDEVDGLQPEPLLSVLSQLRAGYPMRDRGLFPTSIGLVGLRDLRDYVIAVQGGVTPGPTSPFNIKVESLTLENFSRAEIAELYGQHTAETGQAFAPDAIDRAWHWSHGQPLLVNALAGRCVDRTVTDRSVTVRSVDIDEAAEHLIRSRVTHLDNLGERLREPRVARVMRLVLLGDRGEALARTSDDYRYVRDLGLLAEGPDGLAPANPMYAEVLTRQLTIDPQSIIQKR